MIEPFNLGPEPDLSEPPDIDPWMFLPLDESEIFFAELPARQPVRPSVLSFTLLFHAIMLGILIYTQRDNLAKSPKSLQAAIERFARGEPGAGSREVPVQLVPHFPSAQSRPPQPVAPPPGASAPAAVSAPAPPPTPAEQLKIDERTRKYTHINQDEQAAQKPHEKNLYSDRDRKGASPETAANPDRRNPDPVAKGTDGNRNAMSTPGPDVPGEPATREKLAGAPGSDKKAGQNGENGTQMAERGGPVAYNPSTHSVYGVQLSPGQSRIPRGQPGQAAPETPATDGRSGAGKSARPGDLSAKKAGAPGENDKPGSDGEEGQASIRRKLSEYAREAASRVFNNPSGKNYQVGSMSFDTQGYDLGDYDRKVHQAVEREWNPPSVTMGLNIHGCSLASFVIERDGTVSDVTLLNTSNVDPYDKAALTALKNARLPPLPASIKLKRMTTTFGFFINEPMSDKCGTALKRD